MATIRLELIYLKKSKQKKKTKKEEKQKRYESIAA